MPPRPDDERQTHAGSERSCSSPTTTARHLTAPLLQALAFQKGTTPNSEPTVHRCAQVRSVSWRLVDIVLASSGVSRRLLVSLGVISRRFFFCFHHHFSLFFPFFFISSPLFFFCFLGGALTGGTSWPAPKIDSPQQICVQNQTRGGLLVSHFLSPSLFFTIFVVRVLPFISCQVKPRPERSSVSGPRAEEFGDLIFLDHGSAKIGDKNRRISDCFGWSHITFDSLSMQKYLSIGSCC